MDRWARILDQVLRGAADANIAFEDLCALLTRLGFERRTRGSHNAFRKAGIVEIINL